MRIILKTIMAIRSKNQNTLYRNLFREELLEDSFKQAIELFNQNQLCKAYEILFLLWHQSRSPNRKLLYQALLQTCATLQLIQHGKLCGATKVLHKSLRNLAPFAKITKPFNIQQLMKDIYAYSSAAIMLGNCGGDIDVPLITRPKILF
jgi:hypothetical protein